MKAVIFCRVSSKEQEETGYSLPSQEKLLSGYSDKKGFDRAKVFAISETGSKSDQRKTFKEMLKYLVKHKINILVCEKTDRLLRNKKDAVAIDEWLNGDPERSVHFVKEGVVLHRDSKSHEKFIWNIKVSVAQFYTDNLSEEVKKGQKEKISQGWLPTKPPIGYVTVGEKGKKIHIIDKDKAPMVKKMFEYYASGNYSLKKLTQKMYEEGLYTESGKKIAKSRIHGFLTDPFYIGHNRWNGDVYKNGKQEPLISEELFNKVQYLLNSKTTPKYSKHNYLLKGMMVCGACGGTITWEVQKGNVYGHCNGYRDCDQRTLKWIKEDEVETRLAKAFAKLEVKNKRLADWIRKALKEHHAEEIEYNQTTLAQISSKRAVLNNRLDMIYEDKLDGKISEEKYNELFTKYSNELKELDKIESKNTDSRLKYFQLGVNFYNISQKAHEIYNKATLNDKRKLLKLVFKTITLKDSEISFTYTRPFLLLSQAIEAMNSSKVDKIVKNGVKIFEPKEKVDITANISDLEAHRSTLLPREDSNLQPTGYT